MLLVRVGRGGGGIAAPAAAGRGFVGSGLERAVREDEVAVGATARAERWRIRGFAGGSFFSCGGALAALVTGFADAGEGFFVDVADRVDLAVVLLEALELVESCAGSSRSTLSRDEFEFVNKPESGRDWDLSFDTSLDVLSRFCGDCPPWAGGVGTSALWLAVSSMRCPERFLDFSVVS